MSDFALQESQNLILRKICVTGKLWYFHTLYCCHSILREINVFLRFLRYFVLDSGILSYGKSASEVNRGRTHGRIDVGQAVISAKTELFRIDIDDEAFLHHLKVRKLLKFDILPSYFTIFLGKWCRIIWFVVRTTPTAQILQTKPT